MVKEKIKFGILASISTVVGIACGRAAVNSEHVTDTPHFVCSQDNFPSINAFDQVLDPNEHEKASLKFEGMMNFMQNAPLDILKKDRDEIIRLKDTSYLDISESVRFTREPVDIVFFGGFPDLHHSSYRIIFSSDGLLRENISPVDFAVYANKTLRMFRVASSIEGNAATKVAINKEYLEARAWQETIEEVALNLEDQITDPYIQSLIIIYKQSNGEFTKCLKENLISNQPYSAP